MVSYWGYVLFYIFVSVTVPISGFFVHLDQNSGPTKTQLFDKKTGNFTRNSGKISQKLRYSETFSIAQYIRFFKNSAQAAKTQIKFRKTQLFGYICMFLYQKSAQTKSLNNACLTCVLACVCIYVLYIVGYPFQYDMRV